MSSICPRHVRLSFVPGICLALFVTAGCGRKPAPVVAPTPQAAAPVSEAAAPVSRAAWDAETPVGRIVAEAPDTARIFELVGIDYCCGGNRSLASAALEKGAKVETLLSALAVVGASGPAASTRLWEQRPLPELLEHIESTHHVFLRRELPRLAGIIATVARVHDEAHPEMRAVKQTFTALHEELLPHMTYEETIVFPAVRRLSAGERDEALAAALEQMRHEHDGAGAAIHELRRLLKDYEAPADACALFQQMLSGLLALERDTLQHVHLENNVLLPRCLALN